MRGGELTAGKAAASVALGLLVGVTPLWGLHLWIVLAVGLALRLDVPVAYLAANISIPPLLPIITIAEIELGSLVRTGAVMGLNRTELASRGITTFIKDVWIGTAILGPTLALVGSAITYGFIRIRRRGAEDAGAVGAESAAAASANIDRQDAIHRVADRYAHGSIGTRMYVSSKLSADPVGGALLTLAAETSGTSGGLGSVLDVGCGRGQLALLLLEAKGASRVRGVDWDAPKITEANRAASGLDAEFVQGDLRHAPFLEADTVLLIDVLHYFDEREQADLLARAARAAQTRLLIRDIDPDRGWRSAMTRLQERLTTGARYNRGERVFARPIATVVRELEAEGFEVRVEPCWGKTPFSNVLVIGERRGISPDAPR